MGKDIGIILLILFTFLMISEAFPAQTYDQKKAITLEKKRVERRAIEVRYEACVASCLRSCVK